MSQGLLKEFVNVGVQSPSEFEVASDESSSQSVSHRTIEGTSATLRVDGIVQTQDSTCEFKPLVKKNPKTSIITVENCGQRRESSENLNGKNLGKTRKKKRMEKKLTDALGTTRTTSDLERRKLEAELKATEEIARIKQSVIEKRLELELASLQDDYNPNVRTVKQMPQNELKIFENFTEMNESQAEEGQSGPISRTPLLPSPPPPLPPPPAQVIRSPFQPPFPPPISSQNQYPKDYPKTKSSKNESDFLIRNEIRGLKLSPITVGSSEQKYPRPGNLEKLQRNMTLPERGRFRQPIDKPKYEPPPQMGPNPFRPLPDTRRVQQTSVTEAYYERNVGPQLDQEEAGCSPGMGSENGGNSFWKMVMQKVKKKLKRGAPPWQ